MGILLIANYIMGLVWLTVGIYLDGDVFYFTISIINIILGSLCVVLIDIKCLERKINPPK